MNPDQEDRVTKILSQQRAQQGKFEVYKLPCGHESVEIVKPGDQFLQCSVCRKWCRIIWNKAGPKRVQYDA